MDKARIEIWSRIYDSLDKIKLLKESSADRYCYINHDTDEKLFFVISEYNDEKAIFCYFSEEDYIEFLNTLVYDIGESAVFMQNAVLIHGSNKSGLTKQCFGAIKTLDKKYYGSNYPNIIALHSRYTPRELSPEEAEQLSEALPHLYDIEEHSKKQKIESPDMFTAPDGVIAMEIVKNNVSAYKIEKIDASKNKGIHLKIESNSALKKLAKKNAVNYSLALEEMCLPIPAKNDDDIGYFPTLVAIADSKSNEIIYSQMFAPDNYREGIFDAICDIANEEGKPKEIQIFNPALKIYLEDFCKKAHISLKLKDLSSKLSLILNDFINDAFDELIGELLNVNKKENAGKPPLKLFPSDEGTDKGSYVISVSLGTGCYRHIKISVNDTLYDLSDAILDAFNFDNDHCHAFFMDNRAWSRENAYYSDEDEDDFFGFAFQNKKTDTAVLKNVMSVKKKFLYIFDFGDDWRFSCNVLRLTEDECDEPQIIRSVGESPEQYPYFDDEYDEDEE